MICISALMCPLVGYPTLPVPDLGACPQRFAVASGVAPSRLSSVAVLSSDLWPFFVKYIIVLTIGVWVRCRSRKSAQVNNNTVTARDAFTAVRSVRQQGEPSVSERRHPHSCTHALRHHACCACWVKTKISVSCRVRAAAECG